MENSLKYQVRSREIVDLISAMRSGQLTISGYFQRNLVWRETHKHDFIDTILKGFPFPQIFLARGPVDIEKMSAATCVVDGQQRLNAIFDYTKDKFYVNKRKFSSLTLKEKEEFLKYEFAIIDFDLDAGDPRLKEIFRRLNRTFYSLTMIERIATEFSSSQFLLVARALSGDLSNISLTEEQESDASDESEYEDALEGGVDNDFRRDPGIDADTWDWILEQCDGDFSNLIRTKPIFSFQEGQRKVPLMFVLNVICTNIAGFYNRNTKIRTYLEQFNNEFDGALDVIERLNSVARYIDNLELEDGSVWWNKANFFSLVVELAFVDDYPDPLLFSQKLKEFAANPPREYSLAAREAVNNRSERITRSNHIRKMLQS